MVLGIQIFGALFGLFLLYLTFLNFKRKEFTVNEWALWTALAAAFALISLVPDILNPVVRTLNISRKMDLLIILGFMFLTAAIFHTYIVARRNQKKLEEVVRKMAMQEAERGKGRRT
ncbi:DUF2304 domain-containing protein [Candidatus Woesearchaeota archaeon]|nr:DUF2304 domain-containing protein [Candidatus Woesearchaeota archaeon]